MMYDIESQEYIGISQNKKHHPIPEPVKLIVFCIAILVIIIAIGSFMMGIISLVETVIFGSFCQVCPKCENFSVIDPGMM